MSSDKKYQTCLYCMGQGITYCGDEWQEETYGEGAVLEICDECSGTGKVFQSWADYNDYMDLCQNQRTVAEGELCELKDIDGLYFSREHFINTHLIF